MRNKELYSVDEIKNMSYTDFVGFVISGTCLLGLS